MVFYAVQSCIIAYSVVVAFGGFLVAPGFVVRIFLSIDCTDAYPKRRLSMLMSPM